jgi:hypothetical protein
MAKWPDSYENPIYMHDRDHPLSDALYEKYKARRLKMQREGIRDSRSFILSVAGYCKIMLIEAGYAMQENWYRDGSGALRIVDENDKEIFWGCWKMPGVQYERAYVRALEQLLGDPDEEAQD